MMIESGRDSEGGLVVRPVLQLHSGEVVPLSLLWSHDAAGIETKLIELARECHLPSLQSKSVDEPLAASGYRGRSNMS
jgi:hypothetical protein